MSTTALRSTLQAGAAAALLLGAPLAVQAQDVRWSLSIGSPNAAVVINNPQPAYVVAPAPVYYTTEPQVVVIQQPAPVYVTPQVVVVPQHGHRPHHGWRHVQPVQPTFVSPRDPMPRGTGGWDSRLYGPNGPIGGR